MAKCAAICECISYYSLKFVELIRNMAVEGLSSCLRKYGMIHHVNHLLADEAHGISAFLFLKSNTNENVFLLIVCGSFSFRIYTSHW